MIKVISFDIGGTLLKNKENKDRKDNYNIKNLSLLVNADYDEVRSAYKNIFQKKNGTLMELTKLFCDSINIKVNDEIIEFFTNKFKSNEEASINKEDLDLIRRLKEKGYIIILFSNSCVLQENKLQGKDLQNIDYVFYSYDLGYTKNEEESYKIIEEKLGYKPNEFLHIGDDLKSDYLSPKKYGWNSLYYTKEKNNDYEITDLNEIENKLN